MLAGPMKTPRNVLAAALLCLAANAFGQAVTDLLNEAQRAYVRGDTAVAKEKFEHVLRLEPANRVATIHLRRIAAEEKIANAGAAPGKTTEAALAEVILSRVELRELSFTEALEYLRQKGIEVTKGKVAINLVMQFDGAPMTEKISLSLQNVPFTEALRYVCTIGNAEFLFEKHAIVVRPASLTPGVNIPPGAEPKIPGKGQ